MVRGAGAWVEEEHNHLHRIRKEERYEGWKTEGRKDRRKEGRLSRKEGKTECQEERRKVRK